MSKGLIIINSEGRVLRPVDELTDNTLTVGSAMFSAAASLQKTKDDFPHWPSFYSQEFADIKDAISNLNDFQKVMYCIKFLKNV